MIGLSIYFLFIKEDNTQYTDNEIVPRKVTLNETNQKITINNKKLNLKVLNSKLYVNDKDSDIYMGDVRDIYVDKEFALINYRYGNDGYAIGEDGKKINVYVNVLHLHRYNDIDDVHIENNKIMATYNGVKVEYVYDGINVLIQDVDLQETDKPLTAMEITEENRQVKFNGKIISLREVDNNLDPYDIYYNDKKVGSTDASGGAIITSKLILIYFYGGQSPYSINSAITENGQYIKEINNDYLFFDDLYEKDGVIYATAYKEISIYEEDFPLASDKVKIYSNGTQLMIEKVS